MSEDELRMLRDEIDQIDYKIHDLLSARAQLALKIGHVKQKADLKGFYHPEREAEIQARIAAYNRGPLSVESVAKIFRTIMEECLALQEKDSSYAP